MQVLYGFSKKIFKKFILERSFQNPSELPYMRI